MAGLNSGYLGCLNQGALACDALSIAKGQVNEDYVALGSTSFCIADGMGGCEFGAVFARLVGEVSVASMENGCTALEASRAAMAKAALLRKDCRLGKGGAAFFAGRVHDGRLEAAWAGDVVAYRLENDVLIPLNAPQRAQCGGLGNHAGNHDAAASTLFEPVSPATKILVCTDGVWDNCPIDVLKDALASASTPREATSNLLLGKRFSDDATALVLFGHSR